MATGGPAGVAMTALLLLTGCASTPRDFTPQAAQAPQALVQDCKAMVAQGRTGGFRDYRIASSAAGVAVGGLTTAVGGVITAYGPMVASSSAASLGAAALLAGPVIGVLAAYGVSRGVRNGKERRIKQATADCLAEHGHAVTGWTRTAAEPKAL